MHRRPVHADPGGHLDHLRAAQNRPNRVQTLLNHSEFDVSAASHRTLLSSSRSVTGVLIMI
jgi:hypothetical protein